MRFREHIDVVDFIATAIEGEYEPDQIDALLTRHGAKTGIAGFSQLSMRQYVKNMLATAPDSVLANIADDLQLESPPSVVSKLLLPECWRGTTEFKLFISHISKDKHEATNLQRCLGSHAISAFVAHEDISPDELWQTEIKRALCCMDALLAIHTPDFSESNWTQQEIGWALGRPVKVISLRMGEDPTGFTSDRQALPRINRSSEDIAKEIVEMLAKDDATAALLQSAKKTAE